MDLIEKVKENLSNENAVETDSDKTNNTGVFTEKPFKFKIKILEQAIMDYLDFKVIEHNSKKTNKPIEVSDVVNAVVEKALLENTTFYKYSKSYNDLINESSEIRTVLYEHHYFKTETVPLINENKKLKSELKALKEENDVLVKENSNFKSEFDSIKNIINK